MSDSESSKVIEARLRTAIRGAFVADAASMGTHWYYDMDKLHQALGSATPEAPEFKDPPVPQFYSSEEFPGHYGPGQLSPNGEQLLFATEYCGKHRCVTAGHMSVRMKEWAETFGGRQDSATKEFLKCMVAGDRSVELCGADDKQAHCYNKMLPVACLYAGELDMLERVTEAIMVNQTNKTAINFGMAGAFLIETILLGSSLKEALEKVVEKCIVSGWDEVMDACLRALSEAKSKTLEEVMQDLSDDGSGGRSCNLPSTFIVPMYLFYQTVANGQVDEEAYKKAIRSNIMAGGDTCSRGILIGAVLGACIRTIPEDWVAKLDPETLKIVDEATDGILESVG